jgi:hypothetical protein
MGNMIIRIACNPEQSEDESARMRVQETLGSRRLKWYVRIAQFLDYRREDRACLAQQDHYLAWGKTGVYQPQA